MCVCVCVYVCVVVVKPLYDGQVAVAAKCMFRSVIMGSFASLVNAVCACRKTIIFNIEDQLFLINSGTMSLEFDQC